MSSHTQTDFFYFTVGYIFKVAQRPFAVCISLYSHAAFGRLFLRHFLIVSSIITVLSILVACAVMSTVAVWATFIVDCWHVI